MVRGALVCLLRRHGFALVIADTAGKLSCAEHVTRSQEGRDVDVYFDNDAQGHAAPAARATSAS